MPCIGRGSFATRRSPRSARLTLEQLHEQLAAGDVKELPLIIKADVQGSVEVLSETLIKLSTDRVKIKVIHAGAGAITESDVLLASASNAVIIGFNVRPERKATELAQLESVDIRLHTIIYNVTDEIKKAMVGLLAITYKEISSGTSGRSRHFPYHQSWNRGRMHHPGRQNLAGFANPAGARPCGGSRGQNPILAPLQG